MEQRKTPLLDAIVDYTTNRPVYFKIPGHRYEKGISPRWRQWTGVAKMAAKENPGLPVFLYVFHDCAAGLLLFACAVS